MAVNLNHPTLTSLYQPATTQGRSAGACPVCGGLACLCRPRFFAGQLLTDEDLNRLDRYIVEKNKLHNRYLHGAGVVCGLEVFCHPCEGYVSVTAGYALSPCGEDIVVCKDDTVNLCDLLQRCRERPAYDCEPLRPYAVADDCQDLEEEWILAICYDERATRGVMPLRNPASAGGCVRCQCGGAQACNCGCHHQVNGHSSSGVRKAAKATPAQCEPTVTCETYRFELRRPPAPQKGDRKAGGQSEPMRRFLGCLQALTEALPQPPVERTPALLHRWCCAVKAAYQEVILRHGVHDCQLDDRLAAFRCPVPVQDGSDDDYAQRVTAAVAQLSVILAEYLRTCLCSALLPPCPPPAEEGCVRLASIRVRRRDCRILGVCNLDYRQTAISMPALQYWLSVLPLGEPIRQLLARLCCKPMRTEGIEVGQFRRTPPLTHATPFTHAASPGREPTAFATQGTEYTYLAAEAWARRNETVNPYTLVLDALGALDEEGKPLISTLERRNPLEAVLLNQLVLPLVGDFLPEQARVEAQPGQPAATVDVAAELAELRAMMEQQRQTIAGLQQEVQTLRGARGDH